MRALTNPRDQSPAHSGASFGMVIIFFLTIILQRQYYNDHIYGVGYRSFKSN